MNTATIILSFFNSCSTFLNEKKWEGEWRGIKSMYGGILSHKMRVTKLAIARRGHFELQKYPSKRKLYKKDSCFTQDSNLEPVKL